MSKIIQSKTTLEKYFAQKDLDQKTFSEDSAQQFSFITPRAYLDKIDWKNADDPLKKMIWPDEQEQKIKTYQINDPIGDIPQLAVPNLVHRYPDRVLLLLTNFCQINCRFCFRRELTHHSHLANLDEIVGYLTKHPEVREVIFSGGDPLTLSPRYLEKVYLELSKIPHLKIFRFHTRIPVVNPAWVTDKYLTFFTQIANQHQLVIALHINHSQEIDEEVKTICQKLTKLGALLLSQTVLLKGVNNDPKILADLFTNLITLGVKPYYLHHPDLVKGTHHFRLSLEEGLAIYRQTKNLISGIAVPIYVLDLPDGKGKASVESLKKIGPREYEAVNFKNEVVTYFDPTD